MDWGRPFRNFGEKSSTQLPVPSFWRPGRFDSLMGSRGRQRLLSFKVAVTMRRWVLQAACSPRMMHRLHFCG